MVYDQSYTFAGQPIVMSQSCGDRAEVAIYRAFRVVARDIDWAIKIMKY